MAAGEYVSVSSQVDTEQADLRREEQELAENHHEVNAYEDAIKAQLAGYPSMTLKKLQVWLESEQGLSISISAIDKFVRQKLGYRYKKPCSPVSSSVTMSRRPGRNGKRGRKPATCRSSCFWMKPVSRPS